MKRQSPIRQSLVRPVLIGGGERPLVLINGVFAATLGVGVQTMTSIAVATFLGIVIQGVLVALAKYDSSFSRVYARHIKYQSFYPAKAGVNAKPAWVKYRKFP